MTKFVDNSREAYVLLMEYFAITAKKSHFVKFCNITKVNNVKKYQDSSESNENTEIFENEDLFIDAVSNEDFTLFENGGNKWTADLEVNNIFISFKIDTQGAQANISESIESLLLRPRKLEYCKCWSLMNVLKIT